MARRTVESHGAFFIPHLAPGLSVLDCGCGPGSIARGIARRVAPGRVAGVDIGFSQLARARADAASERVGNISFAAADCYALPFGDGAFDRLFSHALMEHLAEPPRALAEFHRVLRAGGIAGVCAPDWDGFVIAPASRRMDEAVAAYKALQARNGGDVRVGGKIGAYLAQAGFASVAVSQRFERPAPQVVAELLAASLDAEGDTRSAAAWREWGAAGGATFAIAWIQCVGVKPA